MNEHFVNLCKLGKALTKTQRKGTLKLRNLNQIQSYGMEDHVSDVMYLNLMLRNQTIYKTSSGN
jgi:hypothetical protein